nr:ribonuclease 3-like protein 2 [Quercus suber]
MDSLLSIEEEESSPWSPALSFCIWFGVAFLVIKSCICKRKKPHQEAKTNMASSTIRAVEKILSYRFKDKSLLEEALTHSSYYNNNSGESFRSYQRLEFVGDTVLGLALSEYLYLEYPSLDAGQLSPLHDANVSNEKLARVAVRHHLDSYIRHNIRDFPLKVQKFAAAVNQEDDKSLYWSIKAPKILADIVESLAAAIYVDLGLDLQKLWVIFRDLLDPLVTPEVLLQQPHPVTTLYDQCQKQGREVDIKDLRIEAKNIASVYVDGAFVASDISDDKDTARRNAAQLALLKLSKSMPTNLRRSDFSFGLNKSFEIEGAKQKLREVCQKKRWDKPSYSIGKEEGPSNDKKYVCSVQIETEDGGLFMAGEEKSRVKEAENSAASCLIRALLDSNII